jgi:DNA-directed RNA polymerase subunit RPC12/RpoP
MIEKESINVMTQAREDAGQAFLGKVQFNVPQYHAVIKALEKQIPYPLKPNKCKGSAIPVCGKCGGIMDLMQGDLNYCPNCGQKLLWEGKECGS